jgi:transposase
MSETLVELDYEPKTPKGDHLLQGKYNDEASHRQRMMQYSQTHSVTSTAIRYRCSRKTVHKWKKRWDGTKGSLHDQSRAPKHPHRTISDEVRNKVIKRLKQCGWTDLLAAFQLSRDRDGYDRSYGAFKALAARLKREKPKKRPTPKRKNKPYQQALYPGEKIQIDVKFVPSECVTDGQKYYQYTAVDECTRWAYREMYDEQSTYSSVDFLRRLIRRFPFKIHEVQTDNGTEFTNALKVTKAQHKTMFEQLLEDEGIKYHRIRIATPRHNGKVERQHRTDSERFYSKLRMYDLDDGRRQLAKYQKESNDTIKTCLGLRSPNEVMADFLPNR